MERNRILIIMIILITSSISLTFVKFLSFYNEYINRITVQKQSIEQRYANITTKLWEPKSTTTNKSVIESTPSRTTTKIKIPIVKTEQMNHNQVIAKRFENRYIQVKNTCKKFQNPKFKIERTRKDYLIYSPKYNFMVCLVAKVSLQLFYSSSIKL